MGLYKHVRELWKKPKQNLGELWAKRLIEWRKSPATVRIKRPTRIDKARSLGYKAKQGIIIVRQRVIRGGRSRETSIKGRRSKAQRRKKIVGMNYQWVSEQRADKKYPNCEVLNSYLVGKDGKYAWYEIILVDTSNPHIVKDKDINWICEKENKGRVYRGLTSAARKARSLRNKGKGAEKVRPSRRANSRMAR